MACNVCRHPKRTQIERDILDGMGYDAIATKYKIGKQSVRTHKNTCIPKNVAAATNNGKKIIKFEAKKEEIANAGAINIAADLLTLRNTVNNILQQFQTMEDDLGQMDDVEVRVRYGIGVKDAILRATDRMVKILDLYAKIQGEIEGERHIHIHQNTEVIAFVQAVHEALKPFPEALAAVQAAMQRIA